MRKSRYPGFRSPLAITQAGFRPDSSIYVHMKAKAAEEVGIGLSPITLPENAIVGEVASAVKKFKWVDFNFELRSVFHLTNFSN